MAVMITFRRSGAGVVPNGGDYLKGRGGDLDEKDAVFKVSIVGPVLWRMTRCPTRASAIQCQERAKLGMENGGEGAGDQRRGLVVRTRRESPCVV